MGDATKALVAAPTGTARLRIFRCIGFVVVAAAQAVEVGVSGGGVTQQVMAFAASATVPQDFESDDGFVLPAATAFSAVPAAAGPAIHFFVEYSIDPA